MTTPRFKIQRLKSLRFWCLHDYRTKIAETYPTWQACIGRAILLAGPTPETAASRRNFNTQSGLGSPGESTFDS